MPSTDRTNTTNSSLDVRDRAVTDLSHDDLLRVVTRLAINAGYNDGCNTGDMQTRGQVVVDLDAGGRRSDATLFMVPTDGPLGSIINAAYDEGFKRGLQGDDAQTLDGYDERRLLRRQ